MIRRLKKAVENGSFGQPASDKAGICSLSRDPLNILMWSHYSQNHTGFVVEFRIPIEAVNITSELFFFENLIPLAVDYTENKPIVDFFDDHDTKLRKQYLTKSSAWKYEKEERVIDYVRGSGIHQYNRDSILSSVLTGMRMQDPEYSIIEEAISKLSDIKIGLHKVRPVEGKFELFVPDRPDLKPLSTN